MDREETTHAIIVKMIYQLGTARAKPVDVDVATLYADLLDVFPLVLVRRGIMALATSRGDFLPSVGEIITAILKYLASEEGTLVLDDDAAWKRAKRLISRYNPYTRPDPGSSGNPAVDRAIADMGGPSNISWSDARDEGHAKRTFLAHYREHMQTAEHLTWALSAQPEAAPVVLGIEGPEASKSTTQAMLGTPPPNIYPALDSGRVLSEEERDEIAGNVATSLAKIQQRTAFMKGAPLADAQPDRKMREVVHEGKVFMVYDDEG